MSSAAEKSLEDLSGKWKLNKDLSDDITKVLAIQGTNKLLRSAIASASVTLKITQPNQNEYAIQQMATSASISGTTEHYLLDYEWRNNHDAFFGDVKGRSKWIKLAEVERDFPELNGDWDVGEGENLIVAEGGKPDGEWTAVRIWGFEQIEGQRRYTQRVKVWNKDEEDVEVKMVYDLAN